MSEKGTCERCEANFIAYPSARRRFCSRSCANEARRRPPQSCPRCGCTFQVKKGFPTKTYCSRSCAYKGQRSPVGSLYLDNKGYYRVLIGVNRWARRSRLVMEATLGRALEEGENVHHINGVKTDDRPENLELWVISQPAGQRPEDLVRWAREILRRYGE